MAINAAALEIDIKATGAAAAERDIRGVGNAVDDTGRKMASAGSQSSTFGKAFSSVGPLAVAGFAGAGAAAAKFGMDSFNAFASFEKQMNEVFSLMPGISQDSMGQMTDQVKTFSREFGVLPQEVVPALYEALSSGIPADNVFSFLETAQKTATGGVTELNTAVDGLTSVVNAFGSDTISAADASDIMFQTVKIGKTTIDELSSSLFNVNPVAAALGVGFDQVGAALAAMTSQGVPTAQATTQLRQLFIELSDSGSKLAQTFTQVAGQSFQEFIAGGGTVQGALQLLEQHAASTGVGIQDLFSSVEAGGAALALTGQGTEMFSNALDQMANRAGSTDAAFGQMQEGVSADVDRMKANFATFQIDVGEKLAGAAVAIMDANLGEKLVNSIQGGLEAAGRLMDKGKELIDGVLNGARDAWEGGKSFFSDLGSSVLDAVGDLASTLLDKGKDLLTGLKNGAEGVWDTVSGWIGERGSAALSAIGDLASTLIDKGRDLLTGLKNGAENVWDSVSGWLGRRGSDALSAIGDLASTLLEKGRDLLTGLKNGAESAWDTVTGFLGGIAGRAASAVGNLAGALVSAGADLIGGLIRGIESQIGRLQGVLSGITNLIPNVKGPPAKDRMLLHESGTLIMQGLARGLIAGFGRYVAPLAEQMTDRIPALVSGASGGARVGADGAITSGWGIVGEAGWEAFHLGPEGLRFYSHEASKRLVGMSRLPGFQGGNAEEGFNEAVRVLAAQVSAGDWANQPSRSGAALALAMLKMGIPSNWPEIAKQAISEALAAGLPENVVVQAIEVAGLNPQFNNVTATMRWLETLIRALQHAMTRDRDLFEVLKQQGELTSFLNIEAMKDALRFGMILPGTSPRGPQLSPALQTAAGLRGYASGGYVPTPHWLVDQRTGRITGEMAERGGEWITPDNPNAARDGGGNGPVNLSLNIDGRTFAHVFLPYLSGEMIANVRGMEGGYG